MTKEIGEFYDMLLEAAGSAGDGDVRRCYHLLNIVLHRVVDNRLAGSTIHFGGLFAKIDYLAKEHKIQSSLSKALSDVRHRLRNIASADDGLLRWAWQQDVEAVAKFICAISKDADIPNRLVAVFPLEHKSFTRSKLIGECMRMVVEEWDDTYIYGQTDELGDTVVMYDFSKKTVDDVYSSGDWTYIRQLLAKGELINLVRPRQHENIIYPELIIYQPDYLVDISGVAACFESYADLPYISLFNKLKTVYPTKAIHLGNLASQFLDEEVHGACDYAASVTSFFHHHALDMAAAEGIDATFHADARKQLENIRQAIHVTLEQEVGAYDAAKVLLEPSFFCEMLGLQGRMDFLQKDFRVLIEQKSGKGGFPQKTPDVPVYQEKHYVQMLLYMALLHYGYKHDGQAIPNSHIQSFLLYSKYSKGLVRLGPAPELLFRAIKLRNQIAWCELSYARGGADILLKLTPEKLRRKMVNEKFWAQYVRPQIAEILSPVQNATQLEQAYFFRMLRFVAMEHVLSKMGANTKENSGFASKWHDALADKLLAGNIYSSLEISELMMEDSAVVDVILTVEADDNVLSTNFRRGDIVVLYAYEGNHDPDVRLTIVHRGTLEDIHIDNGKLVITVHLRAPQTDTEVFKLRKGWHWAVEHDYFESSSTSLYRSLHQFLTAPAHRRALILGQRQPDVDGSVQLRHDYGSFNELVLGAMQARDIFMVIGPPGTGKTSYGLLNILKETYGDVDTEGPRKNILLMSYTNRAVDEICSKLVEEYVDAGNPDPATNGSHIFIRVGSRLSCEPCYRQYLLEERTKDCRNIGEIRDMIDQTHIFVGTTTSLTAAASSLFRLKSFDLAIIDEASQILEPHLLGLLSATNGIDVAIRKFVFIGDHKQLPAVVQQSEAESAVVEPLLQAIGLDNCRNSLFERLLNIYCQPSADGTMPHAYMLRNQGRMHPDIADFPNKAFYGGKLDIARLPHQLEPSALNDKQRVIFIDVPKPEHSSSDKVNENEAKVIARLVHEAYLEAGDDFSLLHTVGVIVPYRNQITAVRKAIDSYGVTLLHDVTIDTVERYQGSQRDVIIYGFTVQYSYQLSFLAANTFTDSVTGAIIDRKLNVAMTRARCREYLVGNPDILSLNPVFRNLIEYCKK